MRHNLLIVDDEELIRQGLKARLEYLQIETDEIFEASNGKEALEIVDSYPVDVVITDIRMPDMDGLKMIKAIQESHKDIQFMVLSGYAEFSYAETAIRLGVKAYLLKPVSNDELKKNFQKIYSAMEKNVKINNAVLRQKKLDREKQEYRLEKEINAFLSAAPEESLSIEQIYQYRGLEFSPESQPDQKMFFAIIRVDQESYANRGFRQGDHELIRFSIKNVFYEMESSCEKLIVNSISDYNRLYALFFLDNEKKLRSEIENIFVKMRSVMEERMEVYLTVGVSKCAGDLRSRSVEEARIALKQRIIYGDSSLYFYEDIKTMEQQYFSSSEMYMLIQYMEKNEVYKIKDLLMEIFSEKRVRRYGTSYLKKMWMRVLNVIYAQYEKKSVHQEDLSGILMNMNLLDKIQSLAEIQQKVIEIVMGCIDTENVAEVNVKSRIQMAVQYIREHYNENITINDLAERYEMSPNYFSSMFKKEVQQSTVNYMTEIRMEEARKLLERSDLSVVDIARKVGYEDSQYFFRVFKKHVGMTPLSYREQNR